MITKSEWIKLSPENVDELKPEDVAFYTTPGRMGDEENHYIGMIDGRLYVTDNWDHDGGTACIAFFERLHAKYPQCDKFWEERYIGFGCGLYIRKKFRRQQPLSSLLRAFQRDETTTSGAPVMVRWMDGFFHFAETFSYLYRREEDD